MISSYRLGDLVLLSLSTTEQNDILTDYPNSLGSKFILEKRKNNRNHNIDIITELVLKDMERHIDLFPRNISESTLIHLRLGDVVGGNEWHEKLKRPLGIDILKSSVVDNSAPIFVIGKCFFAKPSSTNYEECIHLSNEYLRDVMNEFGAEHFDSGDADIDLCCAVKSKVFIQGKGYYSKLIVEIRKKLNLMSIETNVE